MSGIGVIVLSVVLNCHIVVWWFCRCIVWVGQLFRWCPARQTSGNRMIAFITMERSVPRSRQCTPDATQRGRGAVTSLWSATAPFFSPLYFIPLRLLLSLFSLSTMSRVSTLYMSEKRQVRTAFLAAPPDSRPRISPKRGTRVKIIKGCHHSAFSLWRQHK